MEKHEFQPKEWVLTRDDDVEEWKLDIFSHLVDGASFPYICVGGCYSECIPFEGNKSLLGKKGTPEKKHVWHAGDHVDVLSDFDDMWHPGFIVEIDYTRSGSGFNYRVESECFKSIAKNGKVWCKADQLRKPEEKPESAKGWRPKEGEAVEALVNDEWQAATLILDDYTVYAPYYVYLQNGDKTWCTEKQVRPAQKKPFKFGDWVEVLEDGEWTVGIVTEVDEDDEFATYHVNFPEDEGWYSKSKVRKHEKG